MSRDAGSLSPANRLYLLISLPTREKEIPA